MKKILASMSLFLAAAGGICLSSCTNLSLSKNHSNTSSKPKGTHKYEIYRNNLDIHNPRCDLDERIQVDPETNAELLKSKVMPMTYQQLFCLEYHLETYQNIVINPYYNKFTNPYKQNLNVPKLMGTYMYVYNHFSEMLSATGIHREDTTREKIRFIAAFVPPRGINLSQDKQYGMRPPEPGNWFKKDQQIEQGKFWQWLLSHRGEIVDFKGDIMETQNAYKNFGKNIVKDLDSFIKRFNLKTTNKDELIDHLEKGYGFGSAGDFLSFPKNKIIRRQTEAMKLIWMYENLWLDKYKSLSTSPSTSDKEQTMDIVPVNLKPSYPKVPSKEKGPSTSSGMLSALTGVMNSYSEVSCERTTQTLHLPKTLKKQFDLIESRNDMNEYQVACMYNDWMTLWMESEKTTDRRMNDFLIVGAEKYLFSHFNEFLKESNIKESDKKIPQYWLTYTKNFGVIDEDQNQWLNRLKVRSFLLKHKDEIKESFNFALSSPAEHAKKVENFYNHIDEMAIKYGFKLLKSKDETIKILSKFSKVYGIDELLTHDELFSWPTYKGQDIDRIIKLQVPYHRPPNSEMISQLAIITANIES